MEWPQRPRRKIAHDLLAFVVRRVRICLRVVTHEIGVAAIELAKDVFEVVLWVVRDAGGRRLGLRVSGAIRVLVLAWRGGIDAIDLGDDGLQAAQHLVEGVVLQHQDDDMLDRVGGHRVPLCFTLMGFWGDPA